MEWVWQHGISVMGAVIVVGAVLLLIKQRVEQYLTNRIVEDFDEYFQLYAPRINGNNRFITGPELLAKTFPEYPTYLVRRAWKVCVDQGWVMRDPIDYEWVIRRR